MKRKIFSVLFALVLALSLSLIPAVPAAAEPDDTYAACSFQIVETGTAAWVDTEQKWGSYSVELVLGDGVNDAARVVIPAPADTLLSDINTISFWWKCTSTAEVYIAPPLAIFEVDTDNNSEVDQWVVNFVALELENCITAESVDWTERTLPTDNDHWAIFGTDQQGITPETALTWSGVQAAAGTGTVLNCKVALGEGSAESPWPVETVYIDDITVNITTYELEPRVINTDTSEVFNTIQAAIDDGNTVDGHSINVTAGTYNENVVIDESITLESMDGAATTIIDASDSSAAAAVEITASGVTLGGEGAGFTIIAEDRDSSNPGLNHKAIHLTQQVGDVTIEGNVITGGNLSPQLGILIGTFGVSETYSNIKILNNAFNTTWDVAPPDTNPTCGGIKSWTTTKLDGTLLIDTNTITGFTIGMNLQGVSGTSTVPAIISNNTVNGNGYNGIAVDGVGEGWVEVSSNQVYNNGGNGIAIGSTGSGKIKVYRNDVYGNGNGVKVYSGCTASLVLVQYNDIYNNTNTSVTHRSESMDALTYENCGVLNDASGDLDAKYNWWGDISGPNYGHYSESPVGNPGGTGDNVTGNVDKVPWLTRDFQTVLDDNIAYFGFAWVHLGKGWNTLSTPVALDGLAEWVDSEDESRTGVDTWGDYVDLGDGLNIHATSPAYAFDPTAAISPWVPLIDDDADYPLTPCDAIYVRMAEPDIAPVLYSPDTTVPSKELYAGWNLVGLADWEHRGKVGHWPWPSYEDVNLGTAADVALTTVFMVTGDRTGYSLVVSPPMNQNPWSFVREGTVRRDVTGEEDHYYHQYDHMFPTKGYWVFMENGPDILAGFTFTPMSLD